jgi:single-strand DNA-binding protein
MSLNNSVTLIGYLGQDPKRQTNKSKTNVRMSLAVSKKWKDESQQTQERTDWFNVSVWGKQADACLKALRKGSHVAVQGELRASEYADKKHPDVKHWSVEVVASEVKFLNAKSETSAPDAGEPDVDLPSLAD